MRTIRSILAATDFSPDSEEAIRYAIELASALGAQVTLVHVFQPPMYPPDVGALMIGAQILSSMYESAREALARAGSRAEAALEKPVATRLVDDGPPADGVLRAAREIDADLIVMGTHGRTGFKHLLMGSVAEKVVRHADRPVFVTHAPAADHAVPQPT